MAKTMKALSLNIETLRELTLEDVKNVNGGRGHKLSSVMPQPAGPQTGAVQPTSSAMPPHHHKKHHHHGLGPVSSAKPPTI
jgi:hypothetical protein